MSNKRVRAYTEDPDYIPAGSQSPTSTKNMWIGHFTKPNGDIEPVIWVYTQEQLLNAIKVNGYSIKETGIAYKIMTRF